MNAESAKYRDDLEDIVLNTQGTHGTQGTDDDRQNVY